MRIRDYPKEIVVNDYVWEIKWVRKIPYNFPSNTVGLTCEGDKIIYIKLGQTPEERLSTLLHEILHCICMEYKIDLKHRQIYKLEGPLADLLRINFLNPFGF